MRGRRGSGGAVRGVVLAGLLTFCGALTVGPVAAFESSAGSKNFTSPGSAPDYFSNEAAPFDRASHPATPGADRFNTAPIIAGRTHASISQPVVGGAAREIVPSRSGHAYAGYARGRSARSRFYGKAASRQPQTTGHRAAGGHTRYAAHSVGHSRRVFR